MDVALKIVALAVLVTAVAGLSRRLGWPSPLVLLLLGIAASYTPGVPDVHVNPDVVLVGLLPPLLYTAAIRTSLVSLRTNRVPIALLSVGLVAFSTITVGLAVWSLIPAVTLAAGFALGAVVAPPDAVAAAAVARRTGMPRSIVRLLEDESLMNDAAALVALDVAIAALTRSVGAGEVAWRFALAVGGGVVVGLVVAWVLHQVRGLIEDPVLDTTLSFAAPYIAFLPAEAIHSSGILAVVVTGLALGHRSPEVQSAAARLSENLNWRTVQFLLENVVFVLIGLQLREILRAVDHSGVAAQSVVLACGGVLGAAFASRLVWIFLIGGLFRLNRRSRPAAWSWRMQAVVSWAGMRGVITLAAAELLPTDTPQRALLQLCAFSVVAGTLLIQGLTLPRLVRRLGLTGPNPAEDALNTAALVSDAARAGLDRLEELRTEDLPDEMYEELRRRSDVRSNAAWERLGRPQDDTETPSATYRRLRLEMLAAERKVILTARNAGSFDEEVLRGAMVAVDLEESLLDRADDAESTVGEELRINQRKGTCGHLEAAPETARPLTPGECPDCVREGTRWVHLRMCLACGNVGCCDSSQGRHAERHFVRNRHPVMRSVEPGEAWRWCYVDGILD